MPAVGGVGSWRDGPTSSEQSRDITLAWGSASASASTSGYSASSRYLSPQAVEGNHRRRQVDLKLKVDRLEEYRVGYHESRRSSYEPVGQAKGEYKSQPHRPISGGIGLGATEKRSRLLPPPVSPRVPTQSARDAGILTSGKAYRMQAAAGAASTVHSSSDTSALRPKCTAGSISSTPRIALPSDSSSMGIPSHTTTTAVAPAPTRRDAPLPPSRSPPRSPTSSPPSKRSPFAATTRHDARPLENVATSPRPGASSDLAIAVSKPTHAPAGKPLAQRRELSEAREAREMLAEATRLREEAKATVKEMEARAATRELDLRETLARQTSELQAELEAVQKREEEASALLAEEREASADTKRLLRETEERLALAMEREGAIRTELQDADAKAERKATERHRSEADRLEADLQTTRAELADIETQRAGLEAELRAVHAELAENDEQHRRELDVLRAEAVQGREDAATEAEAAAEREAGLRARLTEFEEKAIMMEERCASLEQVQSEAAKVREELAELYCEKDAAGKLREELAEATGRENRALEAAEQAQRDARVDIDLALRRAEEAEAGQRRQEADARVQQEEMQSALDEALARVRTSAVEVERLSGEAQPPAGWAKEREALVKELASVRADLLQVQEAAAADREYADRQLEATIRSVSAEVEAAVEAATRQHAEEKEQWQAQLASLQHSMSQQRGAELSPPDNFPDMLTLLSGVGSTGGLDLLRACGPATVPTERGACKLLTSRGDAYGLSLLLKCDSGADSRSAVR